jgi:hypothetical protein
MGIKRQRTSSASGPSAPVEGVQAESILLHHCKAAAAGTDGQACADLDSKAALGSRGEASVGWGA